MSLFPCSDLLYPLETQQSSSSGTLLPYRTCFTTEQIKQGFRYRGNNRKGFKPQISPPEILHTTNKRAVRVCKHGTPLASRVAVHKAQRESALNRILFTLSFIFSSLAQGGYLGQTRADFCAPVYEQSDFFFFFFINGILKDF